MYSLSRHHPQGGALGCVISPFQGSFSFPGRCPGLCYFPLSGLVLVLVLVLVPRAVPWAVLFRSFRARARARARQVHPFKPGDTDPDTDTDSAPDSNDIYLSSNQDCWPGVTPGV